MVLPMGSGSLVGLLPGLAARTIMSTASTSPGSMALLEHFYAVGFSGSRGRSLTAFIAFAILRAGRGYQIFFRWSYCGPDL